MTERFNVGGAMLLKLFGRRREEDEQFAVKAAVVRDLGVRISLITRIFVAVHAAGAGPGDRARLRRRRPPRHRGHAHRRHPARARHPAAAPARPAAGPLQRPHRRDDRAGQLRAGLRGARPAVADRGEAGRGRAAPRPPRLEFDHVAFTYPRADEISLASLEAVARNESRDTGQVLARHLVRRRARPDGRPGRPVRRRQDHDHPPGRPAVRRRRGRRPGRRPRRPRRDPAVARGRGRLRHPGRAHVPRHHPRQPALRPARRQRRRDLGRARGRPDRAPGPRRCPTGSTRSSGTAATGCPAASGSGSRSPGCCSRRRRSWCSTRRPLTSTASPRRPCSARSTPRSRAAPRWSSRTGSRRFATPTRSWSSTTAGSSSRAPTPSCCARAACTPTSTAPSSPSKDRSSRQSVA